MLRNLLNSGLDAAATPAAELERIRVLNITFLVLAALGIAYVGRFVSIGSWLTAATIGLAVVIAASGIVLLRRRGRPGLVAQLGALAVFVAAVVSVAAGGGLEHRTLGWLYFVPILAGLVAGSLSGLVWGAAAYGAALVFWWLHFAGRAIPNLVPADELARQSFWEISGVFLAVSVVTVTFLAQRRRAEGKMERALRRLEREVEARRRAELEARAASEEKSRFLATMSHELRTPLNSVIGFSSLLLDREQGRSAETALYLERIKDNGTHLLALINEILDISKIESGRMQLSRTPVDVAALAAEVVATSRLAAEKKGLTLDLEAGEGLDAVAADERRLRQVLFNLVDNAIKFTRDGGVTVRILSRGGQRRPHGLEVSDTGRGIPADGLELVFEPFRQVDESTSRDHGGTGLGLPIARALCRLMGFELTVASAPGAGSVFTVIFEPSAALPPPRPRRRGRVLVIDDDPDSRLLLSHYIGDAGLEALTAASAEEGLERARREAPDLITLDLLMPGMTGWTALEHLREDPELREIPVVVISVTTDEDAPLEGAAAFLPKPVDVGQLTRLLARLARGRQEA